MSRVVGARSVAAAVAVSLLLYFPNRDDGSGAILGGVAALIGVAIGLAAGAKYRSLPARFAGEHAQLVALALLSGAGLGVGNLLVNYGMAVSKPVIYDQMVNRWADFSAWSVVFAGPTVEEIAFRVVLLNVLAWLAGRFTSDRRTISYVALGVSSALFGLAHIFYGGVDDSLYKFGMAIKSSAAGLLLGWVYWRWGLVYSIVCHSTANGIHLLLMPALFNVRV